jgi:hypothetical protein
MINRGHRVRGLDRSRRLMIAYPAPNSIAAVTVV